MDILKKQYRDRDKGVDLKAVYQSSLVKKDQLNISSDLSILSKDAKEAISDSVAHLS